MTRQVTDQLYIELDYYYPEEYFVYTAEAAAAVSASATVTATTGFLKDFSITLSGVFTPTVTAEVSKNLTAALVSVATQVTDANRLRGTDATLSATASVTADGNVGGVMDASAALSSAATMTIAAVKSVAAESTISSTFTQTAAAGVFRDITSSMNDEVAMTTSVTITVGFGAGLSSDAGIACVNYRVRNEAADFGALFNTAVSATATVNSFAVLDSASTVSITADRFARTAVALSASATQSTEATSTKPFQAALSSAATQTAVGDRTRSTAVALASTVTLSAAATTYKGIIQNLSAAFTQTTVAEAILLFRDQGYIEFTPQPDIDLSTTFEKFGAKSLSMTNTTSGVNVRGILRTSTGSDQIYDFSNNDWTLEFWFRDSDIGLSTNRKIISFQDTSNTVKLDLYANGNATANNNTYVFDGQFATSPDSASQGTGAFRHYAIVKEGSAIRIYVEGSRITNSTWSAGWTNVRKVTIGEAQGISTANLVDAGYLDELRISDSAIYTGTTITVPTAEFAKSRRNIAHYKFEDYVSGYTDRTPSETVLESGAASLSAAFTQTTAAIKVVSAEADLYADGAQLTLANKSVEAAAALSSAFTQSATALRIKNSAINEMDAHTEIVANGTKIVRASGNGSFTAVATVTVDAKQYKGAQCVTTSAFTQTASAAKTASAISNQTSTFTLAASVRRLRTTTVAQSAAFTQTATVRRLAGLSSAQNSTATVSSIIGSRKQFAGALPSVSTVLTVTGINATGTVLLESQFGLSATGTRIYPLTTAGPAVGVTFKDPASFTTGDLGPFLGNTAVSQQLDVSRFLLSFYVSADTQGTIIDFEHEGVNSDGSNEIRLAKEGSDWFLYYYGNDAASQVYPYVKFALSYDNRPYQHYLLYVDTLSYPDTLAGAQNIYRLYVNGIQQSIDTITQTYSSGSYKHNLDIEQFTVGIKLEQDIGTVPQGNFRGAYDLTDSVTNDPSITQIWMDTDNVYNIGTVLPQFYSGYYQDLGTDGTATGLNQPDYYFRLRDYTEITQGGSAIIAGSALNWYYLDDRQTVSNQYVWTLKSYTATTEQNSSKRFSTINSAALLSGTLTGVSVASASLSATATVTATIGSVEQFSAGMSSTATVTASAAKTVGFQASLSASATLSAAATKLYGIIETLTSAFGLTANARLAITHQGAAALTSVASCVSIGTNFVGVNALLSASASLACEGRIPVLAEAQATLSATATVTADVTVIPPIRTEANLVSEAQVACVAVKAFGGDIQLDANFGISFQLDRRRTTSSSMSSASTLTVDVKRIKTFSANLPAIFSEVVVGTNIHIDPFYQIQVIPETRIGTILPESRVIQVDQETRVNMIL